MTVYSERIKEIKEELKEKTIGEIEREIGLSSFDYTGVGFGYNFQPKYPQTLLDAQEDIKTPELDELENMARSMG
jgi:hypothetical protein